MKTLQKLKGAVARIIFIVTVSASAVSAGILGHILSPLYSWYFFGDLNSPQYRRKVMPSVICFWKMLFDRIFNPEYRFISAISLTQPPLTAPDLSRVRVRSDWPVNDGSCNGCIQCCIQRGCPLIDIANKHCMSYGSFYWRYFNCGRYPENQRQIQYYKCPKWETY